MTSSNWSLMPLGFITRTEERWGCTCIGLTHNCTCTVLFYTFCTSLQLYITCHLNAVPVNDPEAPNKACTFVNGRWSIWTVTLKISKWEVCVCWEMTIPFRWRSADGNDYLCGHCQSQNEVGQTDGKPSNPGKFGPRGFGKPAESENLWRSGLKTHTGTGSYRLEV